MICPICRKHNAKRFCPAKGENICSVCCGTEREVTIDCPSECVYLIASREHYDERRLVDRKDLPFAEREIPSSVIDAREALVMQFLYAICEFAAKNRPVVDSDVAAVSQALAETYQTLANGIVYEKPPAYPLQRELYDLMRAEVEEYKRRDAPDLDVRARIRDSEIRDVLMMFTQVAAVRSNGRPKGRAFLDFMRSQFKPGTFAREEAKIILA